MQIRHTLKPNIGILASLDVENLFINEPVNKTIQMTTNNIYNNPSLPPLKINPNILRKMLLTCTTKVPFYDHLGNIYTPKDGISMGSVLGPIFSNFYMSDLQNRMLNKYICHCHQTDRTWNKVNDPKVDYSGDLRERKVEHEPRLEPSRFMLVINPLSAIGIEYLIILKKNLQYTLDVSTISLFSLMTPMKSTCYKTSSKEIQFLISPMN